jgi:hypothetical protein
MPFTPLLPTRRGVISQNPKLVLVTPTAATLYARDDFQFAIPVRNATLKSDGKIRCHASFG